MKQDYRVPIRQAEVCAVSRNTMPYLLRKIFVYKSTNALALIPIEELEKNF